MSHRREVSLRNDIATRVRAGLPDDDWSEFTVRFGEFNGVMYATESIVVGGRRRGLRIVDVETQAAWAQLKRSGATDRGAWLSSELILTKSGTASFSDNFDRRPNFRAGDHYRFFRAEGLTTRPDDDTLVHELSRFPRVASAIPPWWRELLLASARVDATRARQRESIVASGRVPFADDHGRIARAALYLRTDAETVLATHRELPELHAVLVSVPARGGGKIVLGDDGSVLFGNSTLTAETLIEMFRSGARTAPEAFDEPRDAHPAP